MGIGDAVDPDSAAVELPRSEILAVAAAGNLIVEVSAIKRRRPGYAGQIAQRSGASFDPSFGYMCLPLGAVSWNSGRNRIPYGMLGLSRLADILDRSGMMDDVNSCLLGAH